MRRRHLLLGAALLFGLSIALAWPLPPPSHALRGTPTEDGLWVATFNMNFERLDPATVAAITRIEADVIFLQETHADWQAQLSALSSHPHQHFIPAPAEGGLGVVSRHPIDLVSTSSPEGVRFPGACLDIEAPQGRLSVLHLHLLPPLSDSGSLAVGYWTTPQNRLTELKSHLRCGGGDFDLVLGDLNEGDGPSIDHLSAAGFVESQRALKPVESTWRWETGLGTLRGRPDHIFVGPRLRATAAQVISDSGASDHHPLRVQVSW
jgi:endonuclease/exonuclease/phosphatase (EEP) superfamily protein YafD